MTEEKLNGLVIHDIPSKALFDELVKRGVIGEHDISFVEEDAVESLGITGAYAGQVPIVNSVDVNGVPNRWEAKDLPSGGTGGNYELVEDFAPQEAITTFERSQTPDGVAYNFKKIRVEVLVNNAAVAPSSYNPVKYADNFANITVYNVLNGYRVCIIESYYEDGLHKARGWWADSATNTKVGELHRESINSAHAESGNITNIAITFPGGITNGSEIKIWGIRG